MGATEHPNLNRGQKMNPFELKQTLESMKITVDTRERETEQSKERIQKFGCPHIRKKLFAGDYSAVFTLPTGEEFSMEYLCCIERKYDLTEACMCFTSERMRFIKEFERAKEKGIKMYLLIENGSFEKAYSGQYRSKMHPNALIANLTAWMARYNAHIIFCRSETFPKLCREILYREAKEILTNMEFDA